VSRFRPTPVSTFTRSPAGMAGLAGAGGLRSRLDHGTKLVDGCTPIAFGSGWVVKWYPDAHEATIYFRGAHDGGGEPASDPGARQGRSIRRGVAHGPNVVLALGFGCTRLPTGSTG
jgi:hypothetical protein